ncbi:metallophosphoesterase family protein [Verrucomicrobiota bacterium sgz303538]
MPDNAPLRIAATSDLHYSRHSKGQYRELFAQVSHAADVLLLCGDLTDYGLKEEAELLVEDLLHCTIPIIAVLGNHDYESGHPETVVTVLEHAKVNVLDGESVEIGGVGFAGVCGFGGGFGRRMLNAWGEPAIKHFVQEALDQAMRLERALARLHTPQRVALLHYAPVRDTVMGEDPEIFPFMGSTRLEGPLNRFNVCAAFHGHAHGGAHEGRTGSGIPIFNVAIPVLRKAHPDQPPYLLWEVKREAVPEQQLAATS